MSKDESAEDRWNRIKDFNSALEVVGFLGLGVDSDVLGIKPDSQVWNNLELKNIAVMFDSNLARIGSMTRLLLKEFRHGRYYQRIFDYIYMNEFGQLSQLWDNIITDHYKSNEDIEKLNKFLEKFSDFKNQWISGNRPIGSLASVESSWQDVAGIVSLLDEDTLRGVQDFYSVLLIQTWTAYETMATDAWMSAVNSEPMSLGVNALLSKRREKTSGQEEANETPEKFTPMNLDILKEYKFNLESFLGTMIHSKRKFDFNSLDGIVYAFEETFCFRKDGSRSGKLPELKVWFSGEDHGKLRILEAVRHVFVHRAGRADRPFLERVGDQYSAFAGLEIGDPVLLNGVIVTDLVGASVRRAMALLEGVDKWLTKPE